MGGAVRLGVQGKRVLVTGSARGIGRGIASTLVNAGVKVIVNDLDAELARSVAAEIGAAGGFGGDVSDPDQVGQLFDESTALLGGLDGVVNNAGIGGSIRGTRRQTLEDWQKVIDVNLRGVFLVSQRASNLLGSGGCIINIASVAGLTGQSASNAYGVSKAGVAMMTKTMACDLARFGIRVNAIAPGFIEAPMAQDMLGSIGAEAADNFRRRTPMGRLGKVGEIGNAALFLLSDLSSFVTGITMPVDGGWTAFGGAGYASS